MLRSSNFWIGVIGGIALTYGWHAYQARKASS